MKRALIILIAALACGCSTTKKVQESQHVMAEATEQTDLRAESHQTTEAVAHTTTESASTEDEETCRIELEFDTTQPVDSVTGTPPLKRATITDRRRNRRMETRQQTTDTLKQQTETTLQDSTRRTTRTEVRAEAQTSRKTRPAYLPWLLVGVILVTLAWAGWRTWRR